MAGKRSRTSGAIQRTRNVSAKPIHPVSKTARLSISGVPNGYPALLEDIKSRIRSAQIKAALSVNRELIELYWSIGRDIVLRQEAQGWGKSIVDRLAADLQT